MILSKIFKNTLLVLAACLVLSACATKKEVAIETKKEVAKETKKEEVAKETKKEEVAKETKIEKKEVATEKSIQGQMQGDVYTGTDSVEYLSDGVPDRVFFATNESILTTPARETLRSQAAWLRENSNINIVLEGHADERGTREYNLALGERRANSAKDYLMTYGISSDRISIISYGKEKPVDGGSNPLSWSKNRRSVTVKAN